MDVNFFYSSQSKSVVAAIDCVVKFWTVQNIVGGIDFRTKYYCLHQEQNSYFIPHLKRLVQTKMNNNAVNSLVELRLIAECVSCPLANQSQAECEAEKKSRDFLTKLQIAIVFNGLHAFSFRKQK